MSLLSTFSAASINGWRTTDFINNPFIGKSIITPTTPSAYGENFGISMALSGDGNYLVIGAPEYGASVTTRYGAAYVFYNSSGTWVQQAFIQSAGIQINDVFGASVAINNDGSIIAIGSIQDGPPTNSGTVYVYSRSGTTWNIQATLKPATSQANEEFGASLSMDPTGIYLIIGAPQHDGLASNTGRAILYTRSGSVWTEGTSFTSGLISANSTFGRSVTINATADLIFFSTTGSPNSSIYYSYRTGATWSTAVILSGTDLNDRKYVRFSPDGLYFTIMSQSGAGTVYIYKNTTGAIPGTWVQQTSVSAGSSTATEASISDVIVSTGKRYMMTGSKLYEGLDTTWALVTTFTASNGTNITDGATALNAVGTLFYVGGYRTVTSGIADSGAVYEFAYI
jgi:hypothetical protein